MVHQAGARLCANARRCMAICTCTQLHLSARACQPNFSSSPPKHACIALVLLEPCRCMVQQGAVCVPAPCRARAHVHTHAQLHVHTHKLCLPHSRASRPLRSCCACAKRWATWVCANLAVRVPSAGPPGRVPFVLCVCQPQLLCVCQALGHLGASPPSPWLQNFYAATRPCLRGLDVKGISKLVHGAARMPLRPGQGWLAELLLGG